MKQTFQVILGTVNEKLYHQHKNTLYLNSMKIILLKVRKVCICDSMIEEEIKNSTLFIQDTLYFIEAQ